MNPTDRISRTALASVLLLAAPARALADAPLGEVVITASRSGQGVRIDRIGGSATVIEAPDLEARQTRFVSDLLRDVPGVAVSRAGPVGGLTQVRIRGSEANHVMVLIDGVKANDPAQGEFDFASLIADEVARVEVLRGQQSALYGSDAIGGVIHYITLSGRERPGFSARIEGGAFHTAQGSVRYGGVYGPFDLAVSGSHLATDGAPNARFGVRDLDARNTTVSAKATYAPAEHFRVVGVARYVKAYADANDSDYGSSPSAPSFGLPIDSASYAYYRQRIGLVRAEGELLDGRWTHALGAQTNRTQRRSFADVAQPSGFSDGRRDRFSYDTSLKFRTGDLVHIIAAAVDRELETYRNLPLTASAAPSARQHIDTTGVVGQYDLDWNDRLALGAAVRRDHNTRFQSATTYRMQASYRFETGTRLRGAAGSGIKNPTFTELFGFDPTNFIGNPDLKPERSKGWEVGLEQVLFDKQVKLGAAYFDSRLEHEIYTLFTPAFVATPANRTTQSNQRGVELTAEARIGRQWRVDAAYTGLHAVEDGVKEIRRPDHTASLNVSWRAPGDRFGANLTVRYNGRMTDSYFGAATQTKLLPAFTLVNLDADWKLTPRLQVYGRVENAFDERYEEVYGYRAQGRAAYVGIRASL